MSVILLSDDNIQIRRKLVEKLANDLRVRYKVRGGVMLVFFEENDSPFAVSVGNDVAYTILKAIPKHLSEITAKCIEYAKKMVV